MGRRNEVAGKVVIVTGASAGIGEATALEFARRGARVVLAARRAERLHALARQIGAEGGTALAIPTDITKIDQVTHLVRTTYDRFGRIDGLANIAGWGRYDWFEELMPNDLRQQFEVNLLGLAELTRQVIPIMKAQRSGHIINMSSYASRVAMPPLTVYASTKYAVEGLTDGLRRELIPWGIHVSRVHPSGVKGTEFNRQAQAYGGIRFRSAPVGKVTREDVARRVVDLVERPQREVFLSRLYDVPVVLNRRFPGLLDTFARYFVTNKRKEELFGPLQVKGRAARYRGGALGMALPLAALITGAILALRKR